MALKPLKETVLPSGPEQIEYGFHGPGAILNPAGVTKMQFLQLIRFRANPDGTNPTRVTEPVQIVLFGPAASNDPKIKAAVDKYNAANELLIQQLINDLGE